MAQPFEQGRGVGRGQQFAQCVAAVRLARAAGHGQQVQIMVAQQAAGGFAIAHEAAQHAGGLGAAIDQIAQENEAVAAGRKGNGVQQALQGAVAALHVADEVE